MSLVACKECNAQINSEAKVCPQCGAKPTPKTSRLTWFIAGLFVIAIGKSIFSGSVSSNAQQTAASKPTPDPKKEADFQKVVSVAKWAKRSSKDPASFNLEYAGMTAGGTVCIEFRGKNSFNSVVPGRYIMSDTISGDTNALWNKYCANQTITDFSYARQAI